MDLCEGVGRRAAGDGRYIGLDRADPVRAPLPCAPASVEVAHPSQLTRRDVMVLFGYGVRSSSTVGLV